MQQTALITYNTKDIDGTTIPACIEVEFPVNFAKPVIKSMGGRRIAGTQIEVTDILRIDIKTTRE